MNQSRMIHLVSIFCVVTLDRVKCLTILLLHGNSSMVKTGVSFDPGRYDIIAHLLEADQSQRPKQTKQSNRTQLLPIGIYYEKQTDMFCLALHNGNRRGLGNTNFSCTTTHCAANGIRYGNKVIPKTLVVLDPSSQHFTEVLLVANDFKILWFLVP